MHVDFDFPVRPAVNAVIAEVGPASPVVEVRRARPHALHKTHTVVTKDGRELFVKHHPGGPPDLFRREADALRALAKANLLRVPNVLRAGHYSGLPFVVMEHIELGDPRPDFPEIFGRRLGLLHQSTSHSRFGFDRHNYVGTQRQENTWTPDWVRFFREHRLAVQFRRARDNGHIDATLARLAVSLMDDLHTLLAEPNERPVLLHGNLFATSYMIERSGQPVVVDPAAYYGRREADLATTQLFHPFGERFFHAYNEVWPLRPGWEERFEIYQLYHLLTLMNTYGTRYYPACVTIIERYTT